MIVDNGENMGSLAAIPKFFTSGVWASSNLNHDDGALYRPMWLIWHFLNYQISGQDPFGWHVANVSLHAVNTLLVAALIGRLLPEISVAEQYAGAALFGVHPALTQCVAGISGSTDIVLTTAFVAAFLCYARFRESGRRRDFAWASIWFAIAVLTKEPGFVFPFVVVAYDVSKGRSWRDLPISSYVILLAIAGGYLVIRAVALTSTLPDGESHFEMSVESLSRLVEYALLYARFLAVPWPVVDYMRHVPGGVANGYDIFIGAVAAAGMVYGVLRHREGRFAVIWMVFALAAPLLLALHANGQFAVRFLYLPAAGGAVFATIFLTAVKKHWQWVWPSLPIGLAVILTTLTVVETQTWRSQEAWAKKIVSLDPGAIGGWIALLRYHLYLGEVPKATAVYREVMNQDLPVSDKTQAAEMLGLHYADERKFAESLEIYRWISEQEGFEAKGLLGVGNNYWMLRRYQDARDAYEQARRFAPADLLLLFNLGLLSEQLGDASDAAKYYGDLLRLAPNWSNAQALARARRFLEATGR